jgi:hypothetical protein
MKKHSRVSSVVAVCLAGFIGQLAAFGATTNSVWSLSAVSTFKAGKILVNETVPATAVFLSDGTASLLVGGNELAGNYTVKKTQLTLTPSAGGLTAVKSNAVALIQAHVSAGVTLSVKSVKFSKIKLTNGVPAKASDTVSGKGCEGTKCKGFKLKTLWTNWTLTSGTNF